MLIKGGGGAGNVGQFFKIPPISPERVRVRVCVCRVCVSFVIWARTEDHHNGC